MKVYIKYICAYMKENKHPCTQTVGKNDQSQPHQQSQTTHPQPVLKLALLQRGHPSIMSLPTVTPHPAEKPGQGSYP